MRHPLLSPEAFSVWATDRLQVPFIDEVSASIGIAWRHEGQDVRDVLSLADERMYRAKKAQQASPQLLQQRRFRQPT
ncbi:diguanylate cyclase domain-containing protein [Deinococcus aquatilis]|uniref:diguanylate cyclase domain-containing protein n=1 Tax=Deinococcus aquatilis TaxID=519440 RepID=UPI00036E605B|nr:diguanylate cyclase [Deinococcus aquatilis]